MSNTLRLLYNNAADRSTVTASSTAGSLVASNLLTDRKSDTWRATGTSATLTVTFTATEIVSMFAMPFCNLTSAATFRIKCYTNVADVTPVLDTGVVYAAPSSPLGMWEWGNVPLGVNAYSYGGASYGVAYFAANPIRKMTIDIVDTTNPSGYIEGSRIVAGTYFMPERNAEYGAKWTVVDTSKSERNDSSDLITDLGSRSKKISFDLANMTASDRSAVMNILRGNGLARPVFLSIFPQDSDSSIEQSYQVYGKLSQQSVIGMPYYGAYDTTIEIEEA